MWHRQEAQDGLGGTQVSDLLCFLLNTGDHQKSSLTRIELPSLALKKKRVNRAS